MNRRAFLQIAGATAAASFLPGCVESAMNKSAPVRKPNIIVILADDLGYGHFAANMDDYTREQLNMICQ